MTPIISQIAPFFPRKGAHADMQAHEPKGAP
jgi:hypothetical protein